MLGTLQQSIGKTHWVEDLLLDHTVSKQQKKLELDSDIDEIW